MATAYESDFNGPITRLGFNRLYTIFEAATALIINDTVKGPKIAKGHMVLDGGLCIDDIDSGTDVTLTLRVTDGTTPKDFFTASTVGQAGGVARANLLLSSSAMGYKIPNANYYLELLVVAAPTGGLGTIFMWCDVTSQPQHGD